MTGDGVEIEASAWNKCVMKAGNFILFSIFVGAPFCMNRSMFLSNDLGMWEELRLCCLFCSENILKCKLRCGCDRNSELFHSFSKNRWIFKANNQFPSLSIWNSFILGVSIPCLLLWNNHLTCPKNRCFVTFWGLERSHIPTSTRPGGFYPFWIVLLGPMWSFPGGYTPEI